MSDVRCIWRRTELDHLADKDLADTACGHHDVLADALREHVVDKLYKCVGAAAYLANARLVARAAARGHMALELVLVHEVGEQTGRERARRRMYTYPMLRCCVA